PRLLWHRSPLHGLAGRPLRRRRPSRPRRRRPRPLPPRHRLAHPTLPRRIAARRHRLVRNLIQPLRRSAHHRQDALLDPPPTLPRRKIHAAPRPRLPPQRGPLPAALHARAHDRRCAPGLYLRAVRHRRPRVGLSRSGPALQALPVRTLHARAGRPPLAQSPRMDRDPAGLPLRPRRLLHARDALHLAPPQPLGRRPRTRSQFLVPSPEQLVPRPTSSSSERRPSRPQLPRPFAAAQRGSRPPAQSSSSSSPAFAPPPARRSPHRRSPSQPSAPPTPHPRGPLPSPTPAPRASAPRRGRSAPQTRRQTSSARAESPPRSPRPAFPHPRPSSPRAPSR